MNIPRDQKVPTDENEIPVIAPSDRTEAPDEFEDDEAVREPPRRHPKAS